MSSSIFLKRNIPYFIFLIVVAIVLLFFVNESLGRSIAILVSLLFWLVLFLCTKNSILSSLLYILIVLPFSITYQLPHSVLFFNSEILLSDPYVNGVYVNYLVPTVSIIDLGLLLLVFSIVKEKGIAFFIKILSSYKWYILPFLLFLVVQNILNLEAITILNTLRFLSVLILIVSLPTVFRKTEWKNTKIYILLLSIINVLFQGILGFIQFSGGSSVGYKFLGESQVVSGMQGSSFIELNEELFLRAYGTLPHPNVLAGYFVLCFFMGMFLLYWIEKRYKWIASILALLSVMFTLVTFSRIAILLLIVSIMVLLLTYVLKKGNIRLFSFTPLLFVERFVNLFTRGDTSFNDRVNLFKAGWNVLKENFLIGTGIGNFVKAMQDYVPRTSGGILLLQPVHNIFFLMLTDLGILGSALFIPLAIKILVSNIKKFSIFSLLIALNVVIIGFFDHYLVSLPQGMIILSIFLLLLFGESKSLEKDKDNVYKN
ncbi:MAG: O-antigen ligase family protein [Candidatus Dojkabacteria bacterium]